MSKQPIKKPSEVDPVQIDPVDNDNDKGLVTPKES